MVQHQASPSFTSTFAIPLEPRTFKVKVYTEMTKGFMVADVPNRVYFSVYRVTEDMEVDYLSFSSATVFTRTAIDP